MTVDVTPESEVEHLYSYSIYERPSAEPVQVTETETQSQSQSQSKSKSKSKSVADVRYLIERCLNAARHGSHHVLSLQIRALQEPHYRNDVEMVMAMVQCDTSLESLFFQTRI